MNNFTCAQWTTARRSQTKYLHQSDQHWKTGGKMDLSQWSYKRAYHSLNSFIQQECEAPVQAGTLVVSTCRKSLNQLLETIGLKSNVEHKHLLWAGEMVQNLNPLEEQQVLLAQNHLRSHHFESRKKHSHHLMCFVLFCFANNLSQ